MHTSTSLHPVCILRSVIERVVRIPRVAAGRVDGIDVDFSAGSRGEGKDVPRRGGFCLLVAEFFAFVVSDDSARLAGLLVQVELLSTVILLGWPNSQSACVWSQVVETGELGTRDNFDCS